jgi:putative flippase GtrA
VSDEITSMLELPPSARALSRARSAYRRLSYEVRHPENHKQLIRFLCVGASGYIVNLVSFFVLVHPLSSPDVLAFVLAAAVASTNNFFWNRHWTFKARHDHAGRQAARFFLVSAVVLLLSLGIYKLLVDAGISQHTLADGIAWIIATPLSFVVQKLWSFKA